MKLRYTLVYAAGCLGIITGALTPASAHSGGIGQKATAIGSRQTAYASFQPGTSPGNFVGDSAVYHYADNNTDIFFETSGYNGTRGSLAFYGKSVFIRNVQGQPLTVYSLTWRSATSTYDTLGRTTYTRDGAGDNTYELNESRTSTAASWIPGTRYTRIFDATHRVIKSTTERWRASASKWDTLGQYEYAFNAQGSYTKLIYRYWLQSTHLLDYIDSTLTGYDASGVVSLKDSTYQWKASTGIYKPKNRSINTVNGSGQVVLRQYDLWNTSTSAWVPAGKEITTYTSAGYRAADTSYLWLASAGSYVLNSRVLHSWNSFGQETMYYVEAYNSGVWEHNFSYFLYYEPYNELGVATASSAQALRLNLSPNPASGYIAVDMRWDAPQDFTVTILDMQGRIYQRIPGIMTKQSSLHIPLEDLPAGNYVLSVKGVSGAGLAQMFTVRH